MNSSILPILWAQWRVMTSMRGRWGSRILGVLLTLLWYGIWVLIGFAAAFAASGASRDALRIGVPWALLGVCGYWQLAPILTASMGTSLDLRKLLAWPIPERSLFAIEVMLRVTTGFEMMILLIIGGAGLARNPAVPAWAPVLALPIYTLFNLFLAAGLKSLLERAFARKWVREGFVFLIVLITALPQLVIFMGGERTVKRFAMRDNPVSPWSAAGRLALGEIGPAVPLLVAGWLALAYAFGRWQFRRSLNFDTQAAASRSRAPSRSGSRFEWVFRLPSAVLPDPLGSLLEKEIRTLARSPRFRLVFMMGFSFGFIIWLPVLGSSSEKGGVSDYYPVSVAVYGMMLLAEVIVWNSFGFDRRAAAFYFAAPVPLGQVLMAKNLAALCAVIAEALVISLVCALLPIGIPLVRIFETVFVMIVFSPYLMATGNLSSVRYARAVDPEHSWARQSGTRFQLYLLFLFPVLMIPVTLAYIARFAFESEWAFWIVLTLVAGVGAAFYWVALDSATETAHKRREQFLGRLSEGSGPVSDQ
jgi:ABC-2 type transport system permease protein